MGTWVGTTPPSKKHRDKFTLLLGWIITMHSKLTAIETKSFHLSSFLPPFRWLILFATDFQTFSLSTVSSDKLLLLLLLGAECIKKGMLTVVLHNSASHFVLLCCIPSRQSSVLKRMSCFSANSVHCFSLLDQIKLFCVFLAVKLDLDA